MTSGNERTYIDFIKTDVSTSTSLYGSEYNTSPNRAYTIIPHGKISASIYCGDNNSSRIGLSTNKDQRYNLDVSAKDLIVSYNLTNVSLGTSSSRTGTYAITNGDFSTIPHSIGLFANNINGNFLERVSAKIFNFKLWDNDVLKRNFIPVKRNADNKPGMYDLVTDNFYSNASGTGDFTIGDIVN